MKRTSQIITIEQLLKLLGIPEYETPDHDDSFTVAFNHAKNEDMSDDEAYAAAEKAEQASQDEHYRVWLNAVQSTADWYFEKHKLVLEWRKNGLVKVSPETTWDAAAERIRVTIDGVGWAYVGSTLKEFLDSGPYTAREAVLKHLGSIRSYGAVYGYMEPASMLFKRMR